MTAHIEVQRVGRGRWEWAYRDDGGYEIRGNRWYEDQDEALRASRLAYPDLRIIVRGDEESEPRRATVAVSRGEVARAALAAAALLWLIRRLRDSR